MPSISDILESLTPRVIEERAEPSPIGKAFGELGPQDCRWPLEDGNWCGAEIEEPVYDGHEPVYCKGHAQIAYRTRTIKEG